jgi:hypothetical protein
MYDIPYFLIHVIISINGQVLAILLISLINKLTSQMAFLIVDGEVWKEIDCDCVRVLLGIDDSCIAK